MLDGYVSKLLEKQTSSFTYFFDRTTIDGDRLTFTTKQVHGVWYSFDGDDRSRAIRTKQQDGFYRLKGTWLTHDEAQKTSPPRR